MSREYLFPFRTNSENHSEVNLMHVSEEIHSVLDGEANRTRHEMRKLGACRCTYGKIWMCDGDCLLCKFHSAGRLLSYEKAVEENGDHHAAPCADHAAMSEARIDNHAILKRLSEVFPDALEVGRLIVDGNSERKALEILGIKRTTYRSRLKKAEEALCREFGADSIHDLLSGNY